MYHQKNCVWDCSWLTHPINIHWSLCIFLWSQEVLYPKYAWIYYIPHHPKLWILLILLILLYINAAKQPHCNNCRLQKPWRKPQLKPDFLLTNYKYDQQIAAGIQIQTFNSTRNETSVIVKILMHIEQCNRWMCTSLDAMEWPTIQWQCQLQRQGAWMEAQSNSHQFLHRWMAHKLKRLVEWLATSHK